MPLIPNNLLRGLRHGLVGLAVVAMLMVSFKIHLHAAIDACHDHAQINDGSMALSLSSGLLDCTDAGNVPDGDGCGDCHYASNAVVIPDGAGVIVSDRMWVLACEVEAVTVPDSPSHPPEPPPVLLS